MYKMFEGLSRVRVDEMFTVDGRPNILLLLLFICHKTHIIIKYKKRNYMAIV